MQVHIAGVCDGINGLILPEGLEQLKLNKLQFSLASMYYFRPALWDVVEKEGLIIDSGAFSFMNTKQDLSGFSWTNYIKKYAEFINHYDIKYFLELDIDVIIGYKKTLQLRDLLENLTGKQCIPVWHTPRGIDDFISMCKDYDYVAIGGIVQKQFPPHLHHKFPWFIDKAHEHGARIHGLGYTATKNLSIYKWDSVDSTSWISGGRYKQYHHFDGRIINSMKPKNKRSISYKKLNWHNLQQWIKFQEHAKENL
jgi:hypothetical protein